MKWTPWILHDDSGFPRGVEPDEIVKARMADGYVLAPMPASNIGWHCPGDPVVAYKRRVEAPEQETKVREMEAEV